MKKLTKKSARAKQERSKKLEAVNSAPEESLAQPTPMMLEPRILFDAAMGAAVDAVTQVVESDAAAAAPASDADNADNGDSHEPQSQDQDEGLGNALMALASDAPLDAPAAPEMVAPDMGVHIVQSGDQFTLQNFQFQRDPTLPDDAWLEITVTTTGADMFDAHGEALTLKDYKGAVSEFQAMLQGAKFTPTSGNCTVEVTVKAYQDVGEGPVLLGTDTASVNETVVNPADFVTDASLKHSSDHDQAFTLGNINVGGGNVPADAMMRVTLTPDASLERANQPSVTEGPAVSTGDHGEIILDGTAAQIDRYLDALQFKTSDSAETNVGQFSVGIATSVGGNGVKHPVMKDQDSVTQIIFPDLVEDKDADGLRLSKQPGDEGDNFSLKDINIHELAVSGVVLQMELSAGCDIVLP
ncbi:MAG: hypothetical protein HUK26_03840, partial [Duodenibacillus sp.]|nr:hypothetical protein [Duodenibacillus sp.]